MFLLHKSWRLMVMGGVMVAAGCASKPQPFGDVVGKSQGQATTMEAVAQAPAAPEIAPATAPVVVTAAALENEAREKPGGAAATKSVMVEPPPAQPQTVATTTAVVEVYKPMPVEVDRTGARRDWPRVVAYRPNGNTVAWPLYYNDISDKAPGDLGQLLVEPGVFLLDTLAVPVKMFFVPPWRKVVCDEVKDEVWQPAEH
ncbi:MAG: hypothetical protein NTU53_02580 [Planctomycetota bacterium]|nr:hypothetical protein [Planctomycetota bacterium]